MNRQIFLPFLIPGHVADERMDMKIGIIGAAGLMLEQSGQHLSCWLGHLFIGQISAPIPDIDLLLEPFQFVLHRGIKLALHPVIHRRNHTDSFRGTVSEFDVLDVGNSRPRGIGSQGFHIAVHQSDKLIPRDGLFREIQPFRYLADELTSIHFFTGHEVVSGIEMILENKEPRRLRRGSLLRNSEGVISTAAIPSEPGGLKYILKSDIFLKGEISRDSPSSSSASSESVHFDFSAKMRMMVPVPLRGCFETYSYVP